MAQKNLIKHDFFLFKGVSAYFEDNRTPENYLYYAENSRFDGNRLKTRKGYQKLGAPFTGGTNVKCLLDYETFPSGVSKEYLVAYYNSQFRRVDPATTLNTVIAPTGWTAGDVSVEGVSYNASLYVANGVDSIGKINDVTFSVIATAPKAKFLETWGEKMWAIDNVAPSTIQYTATASASNPTNIEDWTTVGATGAELIGYGGVITAVKRLSTKMYVFKQNWIEEFYDIDISGTYPQPLHRPVSRTAGAINNKSTVIVENDIWFTTPDLEIRSAGSESGYLEVEPRVKDMSVIIGRYKRELDDDQSETVASYANGVYKQAFKKRGSSQNDIIFIYDTETKAWGFDKNTTPNAYVVANGKQYFAVGGNSGQIYLDDSGYSDSGYPMSWKATTALVDDGRPDLAKYARYIYIRGVRSKDTVINAYLIGEDRTRLETHVIPAPSASELTTPLTVQDAFKMIGDDQVGGEGYGGTDDGSPLVYRFNVVFDCGSTDRMFGVEFESSVENQIIAIDEVKLKYIPRGESNYSITS